MTRGTPLEPHDYAALAARWITPELADQAQLRRVDDREGAEILGQKNGARNFAGLLLPYFLPGETVNARDYRIRRDHPEMEDGKEVAKYLGAPGGGNKLYFPPGTDQTMLADASIPIVITEGEFKTLALWRLAHHELSDAAERPRFVPLGLSGVWNFRGVTGKTTDATGVRVDTKGPIPDLGLITWKSRQVVIAFDADVESNEKVRAARSRLTAELKSRGAKIKWLTWPKDLPAGVKGIDDYLAAEGPDDALELLKSAGAPTVTSSEQKSTPREFGSGREDFYRLTLPAFGITFEIDRLRRERNELIGELAVRCDMPGTRSRDGNLSIADFNLSSARARSERAKLLADRSNAPTIDWLGFVEEFCQAVLQKDREGQPAVDLRTLPKPEANDAIKTAGFSLPRRHAAIIFGDGGASKSYTGLYLAGRMAQEDMSVALFDWELAGEDHRDRLERLFGADMPRILYARCERPLVSEVDRLRRIVRENAIEYAFFDSVAFACDGPPEAAEVASRYFRAVRQIGCGSCHIAHITKGENGDKKPFGSAFWHNGARATWFAGLAEESADSDVLSVGFFNRKVNLGRLSQPIGFKISFTDDKTTFSRTEVSDSPDLAVKMSIRQRMAFLLRKGAMTPEAIAEELEAEVDTVKRIGRRYKEYFTVIDGGKIGLLEKRTA